MANITVSTYLDGGTARTAGEAFAISAESVFTIRTDSRIHANAPASSTGSLSSPTYTGLGGEFVIDAQNVRWLAYTGGSGNCPAIGTTISQGGVSGYYLGAWASLASAPIATGAALPASGFIKFREVTGGVFAAGALTGVAATASGADVVGWVEVAFDAGVNFVTPRIGKFKTRGKWFELGTTNGTVGQQVYVPTSGTALTNNYPMGCWVQKPGTDGVKDEDYEFWPGLNGATNGWAKGHLGFAQGATDARGQFVKSVDGSIMQFGEAAVTAGTYASLAAQAGTYAAVALASTYVWENDEIIVNTGATVHGLETGQTTGLDFTLGAGVDGIYTATVLSPYLFKIAAVGSATIVGNVTVRPGVTVTFTAHTLNIGEKVYCDFTSGTGVDGTYEVYAVGSANAYTIKYPHTAAITSGNVSCLHTLIVTSTAHTLAQGNDIYCEFTAGGATSAIYAIKIWTDANIFRINYPHTAAIASSAMNIRQTIGHVPVAGLKIRIPNIIIAECATATRGLNSVPNATIASRPEFDTSAAGAIDIDGLYALSMRSTFAQAYSVSVKRACLMESFEISECATGLDVYDVGIGMYSAQDVQTFILTSNTAGGTVGKVVAQRGNAPGTTDHCTGISYCAGQTIDGLKTGIIQFARSTGITNIITCSNMTIRNLYNLNSYTSLSTSVKMTLEDLDHCDRYIGKSNASAYYGLVVGAGCDSITVDGMTTGLNRTIPSVQPISGPLTVTACTNVKVRNIGTETQPYDYNPWAVNLTGCAYLFYSGYNNNTVKLQKMFMERVRTGYINVQNSDSNFIVEQCQVFQPYSYATLAAYTATLPIKTATFKACTTGALLATGQTSVYGNHWLHAFLAKQDRGLLQLVMNEPSATTTANYTGTLKFTSAGTALMLTVGNTGTWETPEWMKGTTGFYTQECTMTGGTLQTNYDVLYDIDTGSGYAGNWKNASYPRAGAAGTSGQFTFTVTSATGVQVGDYVYGTGIGYKAKVTLINANTITVNVANTATVSGIVRFNYLPNVVVTPATGFKIKVKITTNATSAAAVTFFNIFTKTDAASQALAVYPLDTISLTLNGLVSGSDIVVLNAGTEVERVNVDSNGSTSYTYVYETLGNIDIKVYKRGYIPFSITNYALGSSDASLPIAQVADRNYLE